MNDCDHVWMLNTNIGEMICARCHHVMSTKYFELREKLEQAEKRAEELEDWKAKYENENMDLKVKFRNLEQTKNAWQDKAVHLEAQLKDNTKILKLSDKDFSSLLLGMMLEREKFKKAQYEKETT